MVFQRIYHYPVKFLFLGLAPEFEPDAGCTGKDNAMKPSEALESNRVAIRDIVAKHRACNARVFGSVLHGIDTEQSDLDLLIDPTAQTTLMDVASIQVRLERLLGVTVDVLTPKALPETFRDHIVAEAMPV